MPHFLNSWLGLGLWWMVDSSIDQTLCFRYENSLLTDFRQDLCIATKKFQFQGTCCFQWKAALSKYFFKQQENSIAITVIVKSQRASVTIKSPALLFQFYSIIFVKQLNLRGFPRINAILPWSFPVIWASNFTVSPKDAFCCLAMASGYGKRGLLPPL